jgi:hypothetical protein
MRYVRQKVIILLVLAILANLLLPGMVAFAAESNNNFIVPDSSKQMVISADVSNNKTAEDIIDKMEEDMNKAGIKKDPCFNPCNLTIQDITTDSIIDVPIGTNKTFSWANAGNSGADGSGFGTYGHGFGYANVPGWADAGVFIAFVGNAGDWAWIGNEISVSGSSSRSAKITFKGNWKAQLQTLLKSYGSTAAGKVRISIYDLTTYEDIGGKTVFSKTITGYMPPETGTINDSITVTLKAGHRYALRFGVSAAVDCKYYKDVATAQLCDTNTWGEWTPGPGGFGVDYNQISLEWQ